MLHDATDAVTGQFDLKAATVTRQADKKPAIRRDTLDRYEVSTGHSIVERGFFLFIWTKHLDKART